MRPIPVTSTETSTTATKVAPKKSVVPVEDRVDYSDDLYPTFTAARAMNVLSSGMNGCVEALFENEEFIREYRAKKKELEKKQRPQHKDGKIVKGDDGKPIYEQLSDAQLKKCEAFVTENKAKFEKACQEQKNLSNAKIRFSSKNLGPYLANFLSVMVHQLSVHGLNNVLKQKNKVLKTHHIVDGAESNPNLFCYPLVSNLPSWVNWTDVKGPKPKTVNKDGTTKTEAYVPNGAMYKKFMGQIRNMLQNLAKPLVYDDQYLVESVRKRTKNGKNVMKPVRRNDSIFVECKFSSDAIYFLERLCVELILNSETSLYRQLQSRGTRTVSVDMLQNVFHVLMNNGEDISKPLFTCKLITKLVDDPAAREADAEKLEAMSVGERRKLMSDRADERNSRNKLKKDYAKDGKEWKESEHPTKYLVVYKQVEVQQYELVPNDEDSGFRQFESAVEARTKVYHAVGTKEKKFAVHEAEDDQEDAEDAEESEA